MPVWKNYTANIVERRVTTIEFKARNDDEALRIAEQRAPGTSGFLVDGYEVEELECCETDTLSLAYEVRRAQNNVRKWPDDVKQATGVKKL